MVDPAVVTALQQKRKELLADLERLIEPPEEGASVGFGKRVGDGTTEAVERLATTATARSLLRSLQDVELALRRIDEGTYGTCEMCGRVIPSERLEALPASSRCVGCAST